MASLYTGSEYGEHRPVVVKFGECALTVGWTDDIGPEVARLKDDGPDVEPPELESQVLSET